MWRLYLVQHNYGQVVMGDDSTEEKSANENIETALLEFENSPSIGGLLFECV